MTVSLHVETVDNLFNPLIQNFKTTMKVVLKFRRPGRGLNPCMSVLQTDALPLRHLARMLDTLPFVLILNKELCARNGNRTLHIQYPLRIFYSKYLSTASIPITNLKRPTQGRTFQIGARNGNRTHTSFYAHDILSVACLPISPPRRF